MDWIDMLVICGFLHDVRSEFTDDVSENHCGSHFDWSYE